MVVMVQHYQQRITWWFVCACVNIVPAGDEERLEGYEQVLVV
jgi:hypothetical protein